MSVVDKIAEPGMTAKDFPKDLTGWTFGRLRVVGQGEDYVSPKGKKLQQWRCVCSCPERSERLVVRGALVKGMTKGCRCLRRDQAAFRLSRGKLEELYWGNPKHSTSEIAAIARQVCDNPKITTSTIQHWMRAEGLPRRQGAESQKLRYMKYPEHSLRSLSLAHEGTRRKVESGTYYNPTNFRVNPDNRAKATLACKRYFRLKARARQSELVIQQAREAQRQAEHAEMERILNGELIFD